MKTKIRQKKAVCTAVLCASILLAVFSGIMVARELARYEEGAETYHKLAAQAPGGYCAETPGMDFDALSEINPDITAWLVCGGTPINYPVVQGADNRYYLNHLFDDTENKAGCLYVDAQNTPGFQDENTIIYGHNLLDGSMLSCLLEYSEQGYWEKHPTMRLYTPQQDYTVEIFAAYAAPVTADCWQKTFPTKTEYTGWLEETAAQSFIQPDVKVNSTDRVLTLSTCTNNGKERFVVVGKLVKAA